MAMENKKAVVTGAGSGVGRAVALALFERGYSVALAGRREQPLQETAELGGDTSRTLVVPCDVNDGGAVAALFEQTVAKFGRVDLLFNNAGIGAPPVEIDELSEQDWRSVVDVNLTGSFLCAQQAYKQMKKQSPQGGRIINNGSISAHVPRPFSAPYTSTKHAITGLTRSISLDGRPYDIACGQVDIGNAVTPMTERMTQGLPQANGEVKVEPRMAVEHVGSAVAYMDSLPIDANVQFMTVMATKMPFIGRG